MTKSSVGHHNHNHKSNAMNAILSSREEQDQDGSSFFPKVLFGAANAVGGTGCSVILGVFASSAFVR